MQVIFLDHSLLEKTSQMCAAFHQRRSEHRPFTVSTSTVAVRVTIHRLSVAFRLSFRTLFRHEISVVTRPSSVAVLGERSRLLTRGAVQEMTKKHARYEGVTINEGCDWRQAGSVRGRRIWPPQEPLLHFEPHHVPSAFLRIPAEMVDEGPKNWTHKYNQAPGYRDDT